VVEPLDEGDLGAGQGANSSGSWGLKDSDAAACLSGTSLTVSGVPSGRDSKRPADDSSKSLSHVRQAYWDSATAKLHETFQLHPRWITDPDAPKPEAKEWMQGRGLEMRRSSSHGIDQRAGTVAFGERITTAGKTEGIARIGAIGSRSTGWAPFLNTDRLRATDGLSTGSDRRLSGKYSMKFAAALGIMPQTRDHFAGRRPVIVAVGDKSNNKGLKSRTN